DVARLAHARRQERLAKGIVQLVRTRVVEILSLEIHRPASSLREPPRAVERRRAAAVVAQQRGQLPAEALVRTRPRPRLLQLGQGRHQRLGYELAAVGADAALDSGGGAVAAHTALSARASLGPWS